LHVAAKGTLRLNEGADFERAYNLLEQAAEKTGGSHALAHCLVAHLRATSTGLDISKFNAVNRALRPERIEYGRHQTLRSFLEKFEGLYAEPSLEMFCRTAKLLYEEAPDWLTIRMPATLRLLGQLRPQTAENSLEQLDTLISRIKARAGRAMRTVSTIHKAKGLEYDHVLISNFSAAHFGDDEMSRKIAYVALSRARKSVSILVPQDGASPLLD
jgi:superfamily I DNA/RNA helicase